MLKKRSAVDYDIYGAYVPVILSCPILLSYSVSSLLIVNPSQMDTFYADFKFIQLNSLIKGVFVNFHNFRNFHPHFLSLLDDCKTIDVIHQLVYAMTMN